jgi:hypothetical protein
MTAPMTPKAFARRIRMLSAEGAITSRMERASGRRLGENVWYHSQKEHWLGWLSDQDGPGFYGRATFNRTAQRIYNQINCAPMLVWLSEASGVEKSLLRRAETAVQKAGASYPRQCGAVRRILPWAIVEAALRKATVAKTRPSASGRSK